jgi:hypothetical protein
MARISVILKTKFIVIGLLLLLGVYNNNISAQIDAKIESSIVAVCKDANTPLIKFTGSGGTAPYTFTYHINSQTSKTVQTSVGDTVTIFLPTSTVGTYVYTLTSVADNASPSNTASISDASVSIEIYALPTISVITGSPNLCVGLTTTLLNATTGGVWSSSNQSLATIDASSGEVTAVLAGNPTINYTVTNLNGCSVVETYSLFINALPTVAEITGNSSVCIDQTITLSNVSPGGVWSSANTSTATVNSAGVVTGKAAETVNIQYKVTDANTQCEKAVTKSIVVNSLPVVDPIGGTGTFCKYLTSTLTNTTAGGVWRSVNTAIASVNSSGVVTAVSADTSTIFYRITDANGCFTEVKKLVTISAPSVASIVTNSNTVCIGSQLTATDATSNGTWRSVNANIATINAGTGVITGVAADTVSIKYTITDGVTGCINIASKTITVQAIPVVSFTFPDNQCSGSTVAFSSTVTGAGPYTYSWNYGDNSTLGTTANTSHVFSSLGCGNVTFTVTLTVTDANGCSSSFAQVVTIKQQPIIDYEDSVNPYSHFDNCGLTVSASNYQVGVAKKSGSSNCFSNFAVNWGDGNTINTTTFPIPHTYTAIGSFNLAITATGSNGCSISNNIIVKNVSNPSGGIQNPGSTTNICAPTSPIALAITGWNSNATGTKYVVKFGDGDSAVYYQDAMLLSPYASGNYPTPHIYTTTSAPSVNTFMPGSRPSVTAKRLPSKSYPFTANRRKESLPNWIMA